MSEESYNNVVISEIIRARLDEMGSGAAAKVARQLDIRQQTVSKWRSGENTPKANDWPRVERALGLPPSTFHDAAYGSSRPAAKRATATELPADRVMARLDALEAKVDRLLAATEVAPESPSGTRKGDAPNPPSTN